MRVSYTCSPYRENENEFTPVNGPFERDLAELLF